MRRWWAFSWLVLVVLWVSAAVVGGWYMRALPLALFALWLWWAAYYRLLPRQEVRMGPCGREDGGVFHEVVKTRPFSSGPVRVTCYHPRGFDHLALGRPVQHEHTATPATVGFPFSYVSSAAARGGRYVGLHAHPQGPGGRAFVGTEWEHFHDSSGRAVFHERASA